MKMILITLNTLALLAALAWLIFDKDWEPLITSIGLLGSLLALVFSTKNKDLKIRMEQKGGKNSTNYQSGRDINIGK